MKSPSMPIEILAVTEDRIAWVLDHPGMSHRLKDAPRSAREREPLDILDDLESLHSTLRPRADAQPRRWLGGEK